MRILLSGGAGYIGCHTCLVLADRGHDVVTERAEPIFGRAHVLVGGRYASARHSPRDGPRADERRAENPAAQSANAASSGGRHRARGGRSRFGQLTWVGQPMTICTEAPRSAETSPHD